MNDKINIENNEISIIWKEFLNAIEDFLEQRKSSDSFNDIIGNGLSVFMKIPDAVTASFYSLDEQSYDFKHQRSIPQISQEDIQILYDNAIEDGLVGGALDTNSIITNFNEKNFKIKKTMVVPLTVSKGVIGLVIVNFTKNVEPFSQLFFKLCSLLGSLYATSIENYFVLEEIENSRELLEQKIAARTLDLSQSQRELNAILDTVQTAILVVDETNDSIFRLNPTAEALIGTNQDNIVQKKSTDFLTKQALKKDDNNLKNYESKLTNISGDVLPILRSTSFLNFGEIKYRIESFLDISERKKYEQALKETNTLLELKVKERTIDLQLLVHKLKDEILEREKAEKEVRRMFEKEKELGELKSRFVTMVSHEFRTPLTVIKSAAQMVSKFKGKLKPEDELNYIYRIIKSVDVMTDLIENVLFMGKSKKHQNDLKLNEIIIEDFCFEIIENTKLASEANRNIIFENNTLSPTFTTDIKLLRLILTNLLSNAVKYSEDNTDIFLRVEEKDDKLIYSVEDQGIGIPLEEQEKIFELFYRADNVGAISGTGLGMAVILESVKMLNGNLNLLSNPGKGTIIDVTLPKNIG